MAAAEVGSSLARKWENVLATIARFGTPFRNVAKGTCAISDDPPSGSA